MIIGYNKEELFYTDAADKKPDEEMERIFRSTYGQNWITVMKQFRRYREKYPFYKAFDMAQTDCVYGNASIHLAQLLASNGTKFWMYRFDYGIKGKATHFSEMPYLFRYSNKEDRYGYAPEDESLSEIMNRTWMQFIQNSYKRKDTLPQ